MENEREVKRKGKVAMEGNGERKKKGRQGKKNKEICLLLLQIYGPAPAGHKPYTFNRHDQNSKDIAQRDTATSEFIHNYEKMILLLRCSINALARYQSQTGLLINFAYFKLFVTIQKCLSCCLMCNVTLS